MSDDVPSGFGWNEEKRWINLEKHGIDFAALSALFEKPTLDRVDARKNYGEERVNSLGELDGRILNVTHTERDGRIWLVSARPAKEAERILYREFKVGRFRSDHSA